MVPLKKIRPKIMLKKRARLPKGINLKRMLKKIPEPRLLKVRTEEAKEKTSVVIRVRKAVDAAPNVVEEVLRTWSTGPRSRPPLPKTTSKLKSLRQIRPRMILMLRLTLSQTRSLKPRNLRRLKLATKMLML